MKSKNHSMFAQISSEELSNIRNQIIEPNNNDVFINKENQVLIQVKMLDESESFVPAFFTFEEAKNFMIGDNEVERIDVQLDDSKEFQYFYVPFPKQIEKKEENEKTMNNNN